MTLPVGSTEGVWSHQEPYRYWQAAGMLNTDVVMRVSSHILLTVTDIKPHQYAVAHEYAGKGGMLLIDSAAFGLARAAAKTRGISLADAFTTPPEEIPGWAEFMTVWRRTIDALRTVAWGYIEVDIGGTEGKRKTRAMLEADGYRPIPVIHPITDGWDYFDELADTYDRLCIGNLVGASQSTRIDILKTVAERRRDKKVKWVHALGITASPTWLAAPTESCDSSAPTIPLRFYEPLTQWSALCPSVSSSLKYPFTRDGYRAMGRSLYAGAEVLDASVCHLIKSGRP